MEFNAVVSLQFEDLTVKNYFFLKDELIPMLKTLKKKLENALKMYFFVFLLYLIICLAN